MVQRDGDAEAVGFGGTQRVRDHEAVIDQVVMGEQDALRRSGGAGGVLDTGYVLRGGGVWSEVAAGGEQAVPRRVAEPDHMLGLAAFFEDRAIVRAGVARVQEERANLGLAEDEAELVRTVGGIDVDQDHTGAGGAVLKEDPLETVDGPDADAVAGGQTEADESSGNASGGGVKLRPGEAGVWGADNQGVAVGVERGGAVESFGDGEVK